MCLKGDETMSRLRDKYNKEAVPELMKELGIANRMRVPRLVKIVVNMGFGVDDKDSMKGHVEGLARITGQRPIVTKARKSVSNFKLRAGMPIGAKVTLRGERMYEFLDRLISAALPRIRDFRGVPRNSFDGRGNYSLGLKEQTVFPEIDPNNVASVRGMDVCIVTTARTDQECLALLKKLGMPFAAK